jgi:hypothetical protein
MHKWKAKLDAAAPQSSSQSATTGVANNHREKYVALWIGFSNLLFWLILTGLHAPELQIKRGTGFAGNAIVR